MYIPKYNDMDNHKRELNWLMVFQIVELCLKYITHDPNYNYEDNDDGDGQMDMDEEEEEEEDDEYSDDDDMSWKVQY